VGLEPFQQKDSHDQFDRDTIERSVNEIEGRLDKPFGERTDIKTAECVAYLEQTLLVDSSGGRFTVTLQKTEQKDIGRSLIIKNFSTSILPVQIQAATAEGTIDTARYRSIVNWPWGTLRIQCIGINEWIRI
jgi:hypothetical protein